ncbi:Vacuolar morphogenesis protein 7 [Choanephora cucurbitarum]|uniref:Vacuolar morphogenesis protein 7 n=1 Tax=Choanephora cucurbitarum TaxID=101091 RepID=A0A1C7NRR6_9FUNG|nr:Vacuolar morphogenesis protein 7 [Choanephora cucurbitarum]
MSNNQGSIQAIFIKEIETRYDPKAYMMYRIDIQAAVRQWQVWKRYSDFINLHKQLSHTFPHNPVPAQLPQKRFFPSTISSPDRINDRRERLEGYLRTLHSCRDDRWRKTEIWSRFLGLPDNMTVNDSLTFSSWLDEYDQLVGITREVRSLINSRNAHQGQHEVSDAMQCELKAKKGLVTLSSRLTLLESSLHELSPLVVADEERRRQDKLNNLKTEYTVLQQLVSTVRQEDKRTLPPSVEKEVSPVPCRPSGGRAFGAAFLRQQKEQKKFEETELTRGLDNKELLNYQTQVMQEQDDHIEQFSQMLGRQKELGLAIHHELENQISLLESLDVQVDNTQAKLAFANKKLSML